MQLMPWQTWGVSWWVTLYQKDLDLPRLKVHMQMLPELVRTRNTKLANSVPIKQVLNLRTLHDIMNEVSMSKEMLSEVLRLLKIFHTLPVTTSIAERNFSILRCLKTHLGSNMSQQGLHHTILLYIYKDTTEMQILLIAKTFIAVNESRIH